MKTTLFIALAGVSTVINGRVLPEQTTTWELTALTPFSPESSIVILSDTFPTMNAEDSSTLSCVSLGTASSSTIVAPEDMTRVVTFESASVPSFFVTSLPTSDSIVISMTTSPITSTVSPTSPVTAKTSVPSSTSPCPTLISSTITQVFYDKTGLITFFFTGKFTPTDGSCGNAISMTNSVPTMITLRSTAIASSITSSHTGVNTTDPFHYVFCDIFKWCTTTYTTAVTATSPSITPS